jgi:DNA (cytosine-5)-methyltransferase 1
MATPETHAPGLLAVRSIPWLDSECIKAAASGAAVASQRRQGCDDTPKCLDLFCGAGGAAMGLHRAGFDVTGVDIKEQPNYPFEFIRGDALEQDLTGFDFVWASPPCQAHCDLKHMHNAKKHEDLIPATRLKLIEWGGPYVIENVEGAPLINPMMLCGTMFGLGAEGAELRRHRLFEINYGFFMPPCCYHSAPRVIGVYGGHGRDRRRRVNTQNFSTEARRKAMGIDWMTGSELSQAIPPAYSEFLARKALEFLPAVAGLATSEARDVRCSRNTTAQDSNGRDSRSDESGPS